MKTTTNLGLNKIDLLDSPPDITVLNPNWDNIDTNLNRAIKFQKAGGTGTAITLTNIVLTDGYCVTFIVTTANNAAATTINGKNLYKPGGTASPNLITGKAVTVWYDATGDCFFIKASAEGDAVAANVLAGKKFSNDNDTGITGIMADRGAITITPGTTDQVIPAGYHNGSGKVIGDADLVSGNIRSGVSIFNISGDANVINTSDADVVATDILSGKKAYTKGSLITGSMANLAGQNVYCGAEGVVSLNVYSGNTAYGQLKIKRSPNNGSNGYFDTATTFETHLSNLLPQNIREGVSIAGLMAGTAKTITNCAQISNLSLSVPVCGGQIIANWTNPSDGMIKGVILVVKAGGYPTSPADGTIGYDSNDGAIATSCTITGLTNGTVYYVRGFAYTYQNATRLYTDITTGAQAYATPLNAKGQQIFTSSGTFTVPAAVYSIQVFAVGGGGGGGQGYNWNDTHSGAGYSGGGGGGGFTHTGSISVKPNDQYTVVVGAGGSAGYSSVDGSFSGNGGAGGQSSFGGSLLTANGGGGATTAGGNGGSGGGAGYCAGSIGLFDAGGNGGSDGGNGGGTNYGTGQGSTTRAFGESSNTVYAGGGGGGYGSTSFTGGSGGGGNGYYYNNGVINPTSGQANTGGGGGGGSNVYQTYAAAGGSGIVFVRWGY